MLPSLLLLVAGSATAAPPDADWRTARTERFVVHYPADAEEWSLAAIARLEAMRDRVAAAVGSDLDRTVTVVITDPYATSNGMALPFLRKPRTEIWVTPPESDSVIGWNRRWDEGLLVHEDTHLVHLAMPARGGGGRVADVLTGVGPLARKSPRWLAEGYATVVEGDETGFGRPYSAALASELRRLATEGALPSYAELNGTQRWGGMGFAYGVGAAYLRWLRDRAGEDSLRHLWIRMSAVKSRTFEEAFRGVFGDAPHVLYGRFVAEVTAEAMRHEAERPDEIGSRFLDLDGGTGRPDVSPDGSKLVLTTKAKGRRQLTVWSTTPDPDARKDRDAEIAALLERDPVDIPDTPDTDPVLEQLYARTRLDRGPHDPRWIDEERVLFAGRSLDRQGRLRTDLFIWTPGTGTEHRVTRWADVRVADPAPDGTWAAAIQLRWGVSSVVRVDLATGDLVELAPAADGRVYDAPRVSPDGTRIAWLVMDEGGWQLEVVDVAGGAPRPVPLPVGAQVATPTWTPDGASLLVSLGHRDAMDIAQIPLDGGPARWWTRSRGGATAPTIAGDTFYWLDQDRQGLDVYTAAAPTAPPAVLETDTALPLVGVPEPPDVPLPAVAGVEAGGYGLGPTTGRLLVSSAVARDTAAVEIIERLGDPVGRHEVLLAGGLTRQPGGNGGGAYVRLALRPLPVDLLADAWVVRQGVNRVGAGLGLADTHRWSWGRVTARAGGLYDAQIGGRVTTLLAHGRLEASAVEPGHRVIGIQAAAQIVGGAYSGDSGAWVRGAASVDVLRSWLDVAGRLDAALGSAPAIRLGGVRSGVLPREVQAGQVLEPALAPDALVDDTQLMLRAQIGPTVGAFVQRHTTTDLERGVTLVGVCGRATMARQAFLQIPSMTADGGIACRVATLDGVPDKVCRKLDHWTAWAGLVWRR